MKRNGTILLAAMLLTILLARLDDGATSFRDIVRLENVPAFIGYTAVFYLVLLGVVSAISLAQGPSHPVTALRPLRVVLLVFLAGCATTGTGTGFSPEAESRLRSMGPAFNAAFRVDGTSIETRPDRDLMVQVRDDGTAALPDDERAVQARRMAEWIWDGYGREAGVDSIGIGFTTVASGSSSSRVDYRFSADELDASEGEAP